VRNVKWIQLVRLRHPELRTRWCSFRSANTWCAAHYTSPRKAKCRTSLCLHLANLHSVACGRHGIIINLSWCTTMWSYRWITNSCHFACLQNCVLTTLRALSLLLNNPNYSTLHFSCSHTGVCARILMYEVFCVFSN